MTVWNEPGGNIDDWGDRSSGYRITPANSPTLYKLVDAAAAAVIDGCEAASATGDHSYSERLESLVARANDAIRAARPSELLDALNQLSDLGFDLYSAEYLTAIPIVGATRAQTAMMVPGDPAAPPNIDPDSSKIDKYAPLDMDRPAEPSRGTGGGWLLLLAAAGYLLSR